MVNCDHDYKCRKCGARMRSGDASGFFRITWDLALVVTVLVLLLASRIASADDDVTSTAYVVKPSSGGFVPSDHACGPEIQRRVVDMIDKGLVLDIVVHGQPWVSMMCASAPHLSSGVAYDVDKDRRRIMFWDFGAAVSIELGGAETVRVEVMWIDHDLADRGKSCYVKWRGLAFRK